MVTLLIVAGVVVLLVLLLAATYNGLVKSRNGVDGAWSQVEVQLEKRHDLIPNLVATVQGYATHERSTFEAVTAARSGAVAATTPEDKAAAENTLTAATRGLLVVAEAYPQLQASGQFTSLQQQLASTESGIAYARQYYNDSVQSYNTSRSSIPRVLVAGPFGFHAKQFFAAPAGDSAAPQVSFT